MTKKKIWDIILVCFSVYWTVFFLLDYWDKHPNHVLAFQYFRYTKLCTFLALTGAGLSYLVTRYRNGLISKFYNGTSIYILGIIIVTAITISYNKYLNLDIGINNYLHMYGRLSINFFTGYFVILACYSTGNLILKRYYADVIKHKHFTYDFGLGAIIITMLLFFIGAIGQLKMFVVLPLFLLFIGINYKGSFDFVMDSFIKPFKIKKENGFWGYFTLLILFYFLVLNLYYIDYPFPVGFDSRNLYMNITKEIGLSQGLIPGNPPYNWSLFLSLGVVIFNRIETSLFLSSFTGVLCLLAIFHLCKRLINLKFFPSTVIILIIGTLPAFANQFFVELKTDFGLLFFQLVAVNLLLNYLKLYKSNNSKLSQVEIKLFIFIGLIIGFSIGIKLLSLLSLFAIFLGLFSHKGDLQGTIGVFLVMFALVIILGINNISGLGKKHLGNEIFQWIYLSIGSVLMYLSYLKNKIFFIKYVKITWLVGMLSVFTLSPWLIKNYIETRSLSPLKLLSGGSKGATFDWKKVTDGMKQLNGEE